VGRLAHRLEGGLRASADRAGAGLLQEHRRPPQSAVWSGTGAVVCRGEARGGKDQLTYIGNSEVVTPKGVILHRAPRDQEELCVVEIDPTEARNKAVTPYNDLLRDRREMYYR